MDKKRWLELFSLLAILFFIVWIFASVFTYVLADRMDNAYEEYLDNTDNDQDAIKKYQYEKSQEEYIFITRISFFMINLVIFFLLFTLYLGILIFTAKK